MKRVCYRVFGLCNIINQYFYCMWGVRGAKPPAVEVGVCRDGVVLLN